MPQLPTIFDRIVLNIPHASPVFPFSVKTWYPDITGHISQWTDWYTDWLFNLAAGTDTRIVPVQFPFSRFFCDVERLENDPLEAIGQGIVYTRFGDCCRNLTPHETATIIDRFYVRHIDRLCAQITPSTFLLDCHSFPPSLSDIDVCIGVNDDWSYPGDKLLAMVMSVFTAAGFKTDLNNPYSNAISPKLPFPYSSMMIELNKRIYMTENGQLDYSKVDSIIQALADVYSIVLNTKK